MFLRRPARFCAAQLCHAAASHAPAAGGDPPAGAECQCPGGRARLV